MNKLMGALVLCAASAVAAAAPRQQETFVVHSDRSGEAATITIPASAVCRFSANRAEALVDYVDPQVEAMRLSGDVMIRVKGASQPIQIEADRVVLELTADESTTDESTADQLPVQGPAAAPIHRLRSTEVIEDGEDSQTFVGHVSFTVETSAGAMRIKADRVEHRGAGAASGV